MERALSTQPLSFDDRMKGRVVYFPDPREGVEFVAKVAEMGIHHDIAGKMIPFTLKILGTINMAEGDMHQLVCHTSAHVTRQ